ncbi:uncharacterized protein VTP21DRAFT_519 [Calcarisporiella thermophila]|uniref:uncharacterized protein n=1 Tax=Calcarisporiella thermophila TaxID=911321 RepID=UPI0037423EFE
MNVIKEIQRINEQEAFRGISEAASWHSDYKHSAYVYVGGLPFDLTEGDIICIFSQYGEVTDINLVRDKKTGKSKGFAFVKYEDQRSTILAVDNFNNTKILGRTIRVDHVKNYRPPKDDDRDEDEKETRKHDRKSRSRSRSPHAYSKGNSPSNDTLTHISRQDSCERAYSRDYNRRSRPRSRDRKKY